MRRYPKIPKNLFIKNCVFILTCLNFSHLQSTLHLMQYTYQDVFSTAQNSLWTCQFGHLLVLPPVFWFTTSTSAKCFPVRTFSIQGNKKKPVTWGEIRWIGRVGHGGTVVLVKNCWTRSEVWAGVLVNHPSWNGQIYFENLQKKFTEAKCSPSQY